MPEDAGHRAHTNHIVLFRSGSQATAPAGMPPGKIHSAYAFTAAGGGTIAIVEHYHYPTAQSDLNVFSSTFGLPTASFQQVHTVADGKAPRVNCGWAQEAALDIESAHAMAPNARIELVEAASASRRCLQVCSSVSSCRALSSSRRPALPLCSQPPVPLPAPNVFPQTADSPLQDC